MAGVLFVFDRSGSMGYGLDGNEQTQSGSRRIDYAKAALLQQLDHLSDGDPLGLILLPYDSPCDTAVVVGLGSGHKGRIHGLISGVDVPRTRPSYGGTPLAEAINLAGQVVEQYGGGIKAVVLTDGEETCDGDPVATAQYWRGRGIDVVIEVVGFVVDQAARQQLSAIAMAGGGRYYDAQDASQLSAALTAAVRPVRRGRVARPVSRGPGFVTRIVSWAIVLSGIGFLLVGLYWLWRSLEPLPGSIVATWAVGGIGLLLLGSLAFFAARRLIQGR
jgi:Ca-activated chloride channel family protein